ncbi:MAG: hypothetical protein ACRC9O_11480, partial [Plesiomonas sp.]|uniref:hypothetical protein n=1 Tax=Plesiomonas sp. TaxID=2486279 RepID=UPI003F2FA09C
SVEKKQTVCLCVGVDIWTLSKDFIEHMRQEFLETSGKAANPLPADVVTKSCQGNFAGELLASRDRKVVCTLHCGRSNPVRIRVTAGDHVPISYD